MQHADDHFLADVAALGQRDGPVLDAGLERNGVVGHVDAEDRIPSLDARGLDRLCRDDASAGIGQRCDQIVFARPLDVHAEPRHAELIDARHRHRLFLELELRVVIVRPRRESGRAARSTRSSTAGAFGPCIHTPARLSASEAT